MKNTINIIILALVCVACLVGMEIIQEGLKKQELIECQRWFKHSQQYQGWYSMNWQRQQCLTYNIKLK